MVHITVDFGIIVHIFNLREKHSPPVTFHARFLRNVLTFQIAISEVALKYCVMCFTITFYFDTLNVGLNLLLVQSKWLGWNHNDAKCR